MAPHITSSALGDGEELTLQPSCFNAGKGSLFWRRRKSPASYRNRTLKGPTDYAILAPLNYNRFEAKLSGKYLGPGRIKCEI